MILPKMIASSMLNLKLALPARPIWYPRENMDKNVMIHKVYSTETGMRYSNDTVTRWLYFSTRSFIEEINEYASELRSCSAILLNTPKRVKDLLVRARTYQASDLLHNPQISVFNKKFPCFRTERFGY
jgi:hypothetical protein